MIKINTIKDYTAILSNLKGNSKLSIIRQPNSILNLSILPNSFRNPIKPLSGIRFRDEFGNIDKFRIEFGCRIIDNFEFPFKFGRIAVSFFFILNSLRLLANLSRQELSQNKSILKSNFLIVLVE